MISIFKDEGKSSTQLPASRYPEWADRYVCDVCGRDVTRKFHRGHGHGGLIIGPEQFTCICGARYRSGMTEWDRLRPLTRHNQVRFHIIAAGLVVPLVFFGVFARAAWLNHRPFVFVLWCIGAVIALPFALFGAFTVVHVWAIVASIYRTRFARSGR